MIIIKIGVALILVVAPLAKAQSQSKPGPFRATEGTARVHITMPPGETATTLKELCDLSTLIVDGTVKALQPTRQLSASNLETDATISIARTLKGVASGPELVISQRGGTVGQFTLKPTQYSLVQPGQRYLFFLREDARPDAPQISNVKRYFITGMWSGLFYLDAGKMRVNAEEPDALRKSLEGVSDDQVIALVMDEIAKPTGARPAPFPGATTKP